MTVSGMEATVHLGPGSRLPAWIEVLDRTCFGDTWGDLEEDQHLFAIHPLGWARWRCTAVAGEGELLRVAVASEARRRGVARALLQASEACLRRLGLDTLHLEVRVSNTAARRLYETEGWRSVGLRKAYYQDGEDAMLYAKDVGTPDVPDQ